ncbi:hypothetical protein [Gramella sp. AN32]|uniref:Glycerophosphoryl diester phosphodiesterase membrane domain-containing protein n=1 Tax=Christiangramia antarctica TaxID=2058158 RepID=A0ABW5X9A6_9FLAO|nr:hypothetical protein [Gramella sp. AN32]MCM4156585.1 hypothetical protein [Gramella sp. AN32]
MNQVPIKIRKQRDIGEIISTTFKFVRENFKTSSLIMLKVVGPIFVLLIAAVAFYSYTAIDVSIFTQTTENSGFFISLGLLLLTYMIYVAVMSGTIYHIVQSYANNAGEIISSEVTSGMKQDFGKLILLTFISWIMVFIGLFFLVVTGIYLAVPLSLAAAVMVFERKGVFDSISTAFKLIKGEWWMTFAAMLCIGIIIYLVGLVFQIPIIIYYIFKIFTSLDQMSAADPGSFFGTGYVILSVISTVIQYIIYAILPIGFSLIYFNLNEIKNFTGTYESIDNLGKRD